jgi:hypothetical protein
MKREEEERRRIQDKKQTIEFIIDWILLSAQNDNYKKGKNFFEKVPNHSTTDLSINFWMFEIL